ncbi:MAG: hypothetical protein AAGD08_10260 [Pseudomonadota bacterium]
MELPVVGRWASSWALDSYCRCFRSTVEAAPERRFFHEGKSVSDGLGMHCLQGGSDAAARCLFSFQRLSPLHRYLESEVMGGSPDLGIFFSGTRTRKLFATEIQFLADLNPVFEAKIESPDNPIQRVAHLQAVLEFSDLVVSPSAQVLDELVAYFGADPARLALAPRDRRRPVPPRPKDLEPYLFLLVVDNMVGDGLFRLISLAVQQARLGPVPQPAVVGWNCRRAERVALRELTGWAVCRPMDLDQMAAAMAGASAVVMLGLRGTEGEAMRFASAHARQVVAPRLAGYEAGGAPVLRYDGDAPESLIAAIAEALDRLPTAVVAADAEPPRYPTLTEAVLREQATPELREAAL